MYGSSFTFDGFKSEDLNLHIVSFNKENFIQVPISLANENISFEVEMAYADSMGNPLEIDALTRRLIYSKLITEDYKELTLEDYPDIVFYAKLIPTGVNISSAGKGYFSFKIETNSSNAFSGYKSYEVINDSEDEKEIFFSSYDNLNIDYINPIFEFEIIDNSIDELYIRANNGEIVFDFKDLKDYECLEFGEIIVVDCENHTIDQSVSKPFTNRVSNWNCKFLSINNYDYLTISPKTKLTIKYRIEIKM